MNEFIIDDSKSPTDIKTKLASFQKAIFENIKFLGDQIIDEESAYIKKTIEVKHGHKYSVIIKKDKDGWIIFPDHHDTAVMEEFGLNFPIWRKLYQDYKNAERK